MQHQFGAGSGKWLPDSPALPAGLAVPWPACWLADACRLRPAGRWMRLAVAWPGLSWGVVFFLTRWASGLLGFREQILLGGTRVGLSVLYTPLALIAFALLVAAQDRKVRETGGGDARRCARAVIRGVADLGLFLCFAYAGVSVLVSDFGILLTTTLGPLLVLAWMGLVWSRRAGIGAAFLCAVPFFLFSVWQLAPDLLPLAASPAADTAPRLNEWSRNELLLLERADPDALRLIGESRSEALGVARETMRSYTRANLAGRGFLAGRVSTQLDDTATREHLVTTLLASQWGLLGTLGLLAALLAVALVVLRSAGLGVRSQRGSGSSGPRQNTHPPDARRLVTGGVLAGGTLAVVAAWFPAPANLAAFLVGLAAAGTSLVLPWFVQPREGSLTHRIWSPLRPAQGYAGEEGDDRWSNPYRILFLTALASFVSAGVYMILANYGLVLFTGKNVYLLGLDSLGDTLEALAILTISAGAAGMLEPGERHRVNPNPVSPNRLLQAGRSAE